MISIQASDKLLNLKGKDFLTLADFSSEEIKGLLEKAKQLKEAHLQGAETSILKGKILGMIFEKSSTRTRVSFEAGCCSLGAMPYI